jgi:hypothetical protein
LFLRSAADAAGDFITGYDAGTAVSRFAQGDTQALLGDLVGAQPD